MNYADLKLFDTVNGEAIRLSIYLSGCTHKCEQCFNKALWDFNYGEKFTSETESLILTHFKERESIYSGLSLLGGEPFQNLQIIPFIKKFKQEFPNKNIWIWSGYTFEQIIADSNKLELLKLADILVDGRFEIEKKDLNLKFRGSKNQRVISVQESLKQSKPILY